MFGIICEKELNGVIVSIDNFDNTSFNLCFKIEDYAVRVILHSREVGNVIGALSSNFSLEGFFRDELLNNLTYRYTFLDVYDEFVDMGVL